MIKKIFSKLRLSRLRWHDLRNVTPVSRTFGLDRGTPVDRYYIERFLHENRAFVRGRVLEIAENRYTLKFGSNVTTSEILHVHNTRKATIVGDLTKPETLPSDQMDAFICTQVLNFIFDFHKAIEGSYQMLSKNGVMLASVGGISQISRFDADRWGHYWSFYPQGIESAFKSVFGEHNVEVSSYGNSLSAISFLKGLACEELSKEELDQTDPDYPVTIGIVARKA